jgi:putative Mg2+ transporter-C (MgtC) family protein
VKREIAMFESWTDWIEPPWSQLALVLVAIVGGAIVGAEREAKEKTAGLRTMILVALGSAVFTQVSMLIGDGYGDPGRIAAQIVTGIGFLGAGTILHSAHAIRGMTTAATIWAVAAIGMVAGAGYAAASLGLSLVVLLVLSAASALERRYLGPCRQTVARVAFDPAGGKTLVRIQGVLDNYMVPETTRAVRTLDSGLTQYLFTYCSSHKHHREFLASLMRIVEIREFENADGGE